MAVAGVTHSVVIDGRGYQLADGGWECWSEGTALKEGSYLQRRFRGALSIDHGGDGFLEGVGLLGYRGGRAGLAPALSPRSGPGVGAPLTACAKFAGSLYLAFGNSLYRVSVTTSGADAGRFAGLSAVKTDFPAEVVALAAFGGYLYVALRGAAAWRWDGISWSSLSISPAAWTPWMGFLVGAEGRQLRYSADGSSWRTLAINQDVVSLLPYGRALVVGTTDGLLEIRGRTAGGGRALDAQVVPMLASAAMNAYSTGQQSFSRLVEFQGNLVFWAGRRLYTTDGVQLRVQELEGQFSDLAVAGNLLFAIVDDSLWAWDGHGFWEVSRGYSLGRIFSSQGVLRDGGLVVGDRSTSSIWLVWLPEGSVYAPEPTSTGYIVSSLVDGDHPTEVKEWQWLTAQFGTAGNYPLAGGNSVSLSVSLDLGGSWVQVAGATDISRDSYLKADLRGIRSRTLLWKVALSGSSYSQPMLRSVRVDYCWANRGRRHWRLRIPVRDGLAGIDGAALPPALEMLDQLIALPGSGPIDFQDVTGQTHKVIVTQARPRMQLVQGQLLQGTVEVDMEEVA